MVITFCCSSYS